MKMPQFTLSMIKSKIEELKGKQIDMQVCRGRKQISNYSGTIENTFSSVFVVRLKNPSTQQEMLSYSYSDVLCGDVKIRQSK